MKRTVLSISYVLCALAFVNPLYAQDVGVAWAGQSGMANRVLEGVQERLAEVAPDIKLEIHDALPSVGELDVVSRKFQEDGKDAQIILRSNGTVYLGENPPSIPSFIGGNNHPVELGAVASMQAPGGMVTGVTYHIPLTPVLESFMLLHPYMDSLLLLSQENYVSSAIDWKGTKQACDELGLTCAQELISDSDDIIDVLEKNAGQYSAIVLGNQAKVFENVATVVKHAPDVPLFSYADVAIKRDDNPKLIINMQAVNRYGLAVPASILGIAELVE